MIMNRSWEASYPVRLRGYRVDRAGLPDSVDFFTRTARLHVGDAHAFTVVLPDGTCESLSFAQVDELAEAFGAFLRHRLGSTRGKVVAVQLPNCLQFVVAVLGSWKAGAIVTPVNPLYTPRERDIQLVDSGASLLVAPAFGGGAVSPVACQEVILVDNWGPSVRTVTSFKSDDGKGLLNFDDAISLGRAYPSALTERHEVALYQYTGGTTGRSKGAVLSHRNLLAAMKIVDDFTSAYGLTFGPSDTLLTVLPLYHVYAFVLSFLLFFSHGSRNILVPNPRPLANLKPAFEQYSINYMSGVDTLYAGLLHEPWLRDNSRSLKYAFAGGAPLKRSTRERWLGEICPILEGYGLTETCSVVAFNPPGPNRKDGTVGLPLPETDLRIIDGAGQQVAYGERGELLIRGPQVMAGYTSSEETEMAFIDGWFRTGDVVVMDADGYLEVVDRKKDVVLVSGFNVYPNEVEAVIAEHPGVREIAVVGTPDETTGEALAAFVVRQGDELQAEELITHCRGRLAAYKIPKRVIFRDQLPKSNVGKVLRSELGKELTRAGAPDLQA